MFETNLKYHLAPLDTKVKCPEYYYVFYAVTLLFSYSKI